MIYITGDVHGDWISRLRKASFPEQKNLTRDDYVFIAGDFGIWDNSSEENYKLDWLEDRNFTTLFIEGNHSNYDILDALPVEMWHGGKVHFVRPHIIHLMRGQVYEICGKKIFTFGGAKSHDIQDGILEPGDNRIHKWSRDYYKMFRVNHVSWWERELPNQEEMDEGRKNLAEHNNKVDFIITHCASSSTQALLSQGFFAADKLTDYLEIIKQTIEYEKWFFGHYHIDKVIDEKDLCVFRKIMQIV